MLAYQFDPITNHNTISTSINFETDKKTIQEIIDHYNAGRLNLSPAFQRDSVWTESQRKKLIKSILENIPMPSIFLYEREENGTITYDVIDGKQRLESIFMFMGLKGFKNSHFAAKLEWEEDSKLEVGDYYWDDLIDSEKAIIHNYKIQSTTVKCSFIDVAKIFVMINSTGSSLTAQEIRKAKYYKSEFLRRAFTLAEKLIVKNYFLENNILSNKQIQRQKHIELVSELLLSIFHKSPINKKQVIDDALNTNALKGKQLDMVSSSFLETMKLVKRVFPNISNTRFKGLADFYTVFMLVWKWRHVDKLVLNDTHKNKLAAGYLTEFGYNIDRVRLKQKALEKIDDSDKPFVDYILTVQSSTDEINHRKHREIILDSLLAGNFTAKDPNRTFNDLQKRILWHLSKEKCSDCNAKLTINNFHADHIIAHSKGGKTKLENAQILCPTCNIRKNDK